MSPLTPPPRTCPKGTRIVACRNSFASGVSADTRPIASLAGTNSVPEKKASLLLMARGPLDVGRGSCSDDRHDDGRRRPLEVDSVVCDEVCASFVAGPPGRVSITMRKGSRITELPSVVTPHRRWDAALRDSLIAFDPPVTSCWRAVSRSAIRSALAGSSGSADPSLVEVPPNPFAQLFGNAP